MSGITSTSTEVSLGEQQTHEHTIKLNNFKRFISTQREFRSNHIEIFPGKKIAFVIKILEEISPNGNKFTHYATSGTQWIAITEDDKFFSLELLADKFSTPLSLAGKVELILGETNQAFNFGDPQKEKYLEFDATNRSLVLKPGKVSNIKAYDCSYHASPASLIHVKLSDAAREEVSLEIQFILFYHGKITQTQEISLPDSLDSSRYLSIQNMKIMKDISTADLKITCGVKEKKKIFNVHKNFFCASSPVFRATIESDMIEGRTSEIYIEEVDEETLQEMINYVYTGELIGPDFNVQMMAWVADKYDLPGMMDLVCFRMKDDDVIEPEIIADMLIAAGKINTFPLPVI